MSVSSSATLEPSHRFELAEFYGEFLDGHEPPELERQIERLIDPASGRETLHWGRNYLYTADLELAGGPVEVVVKQFRNQGSLAQLRRKLRGSKARKNWRAALHLTDQGVETPRPLLWIESKAPEGPSFFISEHTTGCFEMRELVRKLNEDERAAEIPEVDPKKIFAALGGYLRRLHEARVWHRDLSIGNLLVCQKPDGHPTFVVIDLNRARLNQRLGMWRRTHDLSRLPVVWPELRRAFLDSYWRENVPALSARMLLFQFHVRAYLLKHWVKNHVRAPIKSLFGKLKPRRAHVHIPEAPEGASSRDKIVWDRLSDQPHQHAGSIEKSTTRFADLGLHAKAAKHTVAALPRLRRRYVELREARYSEPVPWGGVGVAVRPWSEDPQAPIEMLGELGVKHVLLRLHPWQETHDEELELAKALDANGHELAFSLPQNRDLVRDRSSWRAGIEQLAELFLPYGKSFQVGQAVNRSKWGVWTYQEYVDLAADAAEILRAAGDVTLLGGSVIDFEPHATAGLLNTPHPDLRFDAAAHLLYVDRRGAPENPQLGFDTVDKLTLVHAISSSSRLCGDRSWITEVNWPLREGPHSPAGKDVAVDEEAQADYLVRYYLLTLGSGLAERVYWWQLIARGYGLVSPGEGEGLRKRPAFAALRTMVAQLEGATFLGPLPSEEGAFLYRFEREGREVVVAWSNGGERSVELPGEPAAAIRRDGGDLSASRAHVVLSASPAYYDIGPTRES